MYSVFNSNFNPFLNYEMYTKIQNIYYNLLIHALQKHCRVFIMRLDVHLPQDMNQGVIMDFNHRFIEKEKNAGYDPLYMVVRELSSTGNIHYHMVLFLDGNKTNNPYTHYQNARIVLGNVCGDYGCINECNNRHRNGIMIERNINSYMDLYEALRQISYLAKTNQKDNVPGKTFFYSKVHILPLSNEDITSLFKSLFPYLSFGKTKWYTD